MKIGNVVQTKSYAFVVKIVRLYQYLATEKKEFVLSRQILKCGTSIGANVEESIGGQSRSDFLSKISVAYKEARETAYQLRLLRDTDYLTDEQFDSLNNDVQEICRIIGAIQKSTKENATNEPPQLHPPKLNS